MEVIQIAAFYRDNRFVEGEPVLHPIAEQCKTRLGVAAKGFHNFTIFPAAFLLHDHWHIEVKQGDKGRDTLRQQLVDDVVIEIDRFGIDLAGAVRDQSRPAQGCTKAVVL
ncbi:hypothetical protein D3C73_1424790 [compost metagenome]